MFQNNFTARKLIFIWEKCRKKRRKLRRKENNMFTRKCFVYFRKLQAYKSEDFKRSNKQNSEKI